jgi:hypothetical protein
MMNVEGNRGEGSNLQWSGETNCRVSVPLLALANIAIECWRVTCWAFESGHDRDRIVARQTSRELKSLLDGLGFEIRDLTGQPYDPGLAVDVLDAQDGGDSAAGSAKIVETIVPIVLWRGRVVKAGQVVISREGGEG